MLLLPEKPAGPAWPPSCVLCLVFAAEEHQGAVLDRALFTGAAPCPQLYLPTSLGLTLKGRQAGGTRHPEPRAEAWTELPIRPGPWRGGEDLHTDQHNLLPESPAPQTLFGLVQMSPCLEPLEPQPLRVERPLSDLLVIFCCCFPSKDAERVHILPGPGAGLGERLRDPAGPPPGRSAASGVSLGGGVG